MNILPIQPLHIMLRLINPSLYEITAITVIFSDFYRFFLIFLLPF